MSNVNEIDNNSEVTIYKTAVPPAINKAMRNSSSSEEDIQLDTSDEIDNFNLSNLHLHKQFEGIPTLPGQGQGQEDQLAGIEMQPRGTRGPDVPCDRDNGTAGR